MFSLFRMSAPKRAPKPEVPVSTAATILEG
jgi:hypothetical protein